MTDYSDLNEADQVRMLWATDPTYGGSVKLAATNELVRDFREWLELACKHVARGIVCIKAKNGASMYRAQCFHCGLPVGQWIPKADVPNIDSVPEVRPDRLAEYEQLRLIAWKSKQSRHADQQLKADDTEYAQYLKSPAWKQKRAKVFKRSNGICEGCGDNLATQVHHLTYRHVRNEFLWELVAICDECHERVHSEDEA